MGTHFNSLQQTYFDQDVTISEDFTFIEEETIGAWASLIHDFSPLFNNAIQPTLRLNAHHFENDADMNWIWASSFVQRVGNDFIGQGSLGFLETERDQLLEEINDGEHFMTRFVIDQTEISEGQVYQIDLNTEWDLFDDFIQNRTLVYAERVTWEENSTRATADIGKIIVQRPVFGQIPGPYTPGFDNSTDNGTTALTLNHRMTLLDDAIGLTYGWRHDEDDGRKLRDNFTGTVSDAPKTSVEQERYGFTLKPLQLLKVTDNALFSDATIYYLYSDSVEPTQKLLQFPLLPLSDPRNSEINFSPTGEIEEIGLKAELFGGRLGMTISYFEFTQTAQGPTFDRETVEPGTEGMMETVIFGNSNDGIEIEFTGSLFTPRLTFIGSLLFLDQSVLLPGIGRVRQRGVSENEARILLNYDMRDGSGNGFQFRFGAVHHGGQAANSTNTEWADGGTKYDVGFEYSRNNWTYQLMINNVTNAIVPQEVNGWRYTTLLPPRQLRFTANYAF
jgi:hypothetical protein